jgi:hypothetical protein
MERNYEQLLEDRESRKREEREDEEAISGEQKARTQNCFSGTQEEAPREGRILGQDAW